MWIHSQTAMWFFPGSSPTSFLPPHHCLFLFWYFCIMVNKAIQKKKKKLPKPSVSFWKASTTFLFIWSFNLPSGHILSPRPLSGGQSWLFLRVKSHQRELPSLKLLSPWLGSASFSFVYKSLFLLANPYFSLWFISSLKAGAGFLIFNVSSAIGNSIDTQHFLQIVKIVTKSLLIEIPSFSPITYICS